MIPRKNLQSKIKQSGIPCIHFRHNILKTFYQIKLVDRNEISLLVLILFSLWKKRKKQNAEQNAAGEKRKEKKENTQNI